MQFLRQWLRIAIDAAYAFNEDDGWALASHIALSALLALFPFLIVVTALAGYMGSKEIADNLADILLQTWPTQVAEPLAREIHNVLTTTRGDVLTVGVVLSVYFASSGVDSLRIALNRAYNVTETRSIWLLKLESIGYVLVAVLSLLALGFLIVLAPLVFATCGQVRALACAAREPADLLALWHRGHHDRDCTGRRAQMAARRAGAVSEISRRA